MSDIIQVVIRLASVGILSLLAYILWIVSKIVVAAMICKHPELSDNKVKYLTNMMSKNKSARIN